jgi:hypothetical protein
MTDSPDTYNPDDIEATWREQWQRMDVDQYEDTDSPDYYRVHSGFGGYPDRIAYHTGGYNISK